MEDGKKFFEAKYESPLLSSLNQISQTANKCIYIVKGEKYNNPPRKVFQSFILRQIRARVQWIFSSVI